MRVIGQIAAALRQGGRALQPRGELTFIRRSLLVIVIPLLAALIQLAWQEKQRAVLLQVSPDGKKLALVRAIGRDSQRGFQQDYVRGTVEVWDLVGGRRLVCRSQTAAIGCLSFSPDSRILAAAEQSGRIDLWDAATGRTCGLLEHAPFLGRPFVVTWEQHGSKSLRGIRRPAASPWNPRPVELTRIHTLIDYCPPGGRIVGAHSGGGPWRVSVFDIDLDGLQGVCSIPFCDRYELFSAGQKLAVLEASTVKIYDIASRQLLKSWQVGGYCSAMSMSRDGSLLALVRAGRIQLWTANGELQGMPFPIPDTTTSIDFIPGDRRLISVDDDSAKLWETNTGEITVALDRHRGWLLQFVSVVVALGVWFTVWVLCRGERRRSWQPLFDVLALHAALLGVALLRVDRGGVQPSFDRPATIVLLASVASLLSLLVLWVVFGAPRWPLRIAGLVAGFALAWGLMLWLWQHEYGLDSNLFGLACYLVLLQIGYFKQRQLRGLRMAHEGPAGPTVLGGHQQRQLSVLDALIWLTALALLLAIARFATPGLMPWQLCLLVAVAGCSLAATALGALRIHLETPPWFPRLLGCVVVAAVGAAASRMANSLGQGRLNFWWFWGLHLLLAALLISSMCIFRLHGYRFVRFSLARN